MPLQKISLVIATAQSTRSADLIVVPLTKGAFHPSPSLSSVSSSASSFIQTVLRKRKITHRSAALSLTVPRSVRNDDFVTVAILPSDYAEKKDHFERLQAIRALGSSCAEHAKRNKSRTVVIDTTPLEPLSGDEQGALVEGLLLSLYSFDDYRSSATRSPLKTISLVGGVVTREVLARSTIICEAVSLARDLVNTPARDCTPSKLKSTATRVARSGRLAMKS